jgi:hypothetical protein
MVESSMKMFLVENMHDDFVGKLEKLILIRGMNGLFPKLIKH